MVTGRTRPKIYILFGTRPEAIKMAPIIKQLEADKDQLDTVVCVTGQHRQMLDQVLATFDIEPDIDLNLMQENQTLASLSARAMEAVANTYNEIRPDMVLVQGDTTTAMIGALAAHYYEIPVGHVEAGLRTNNRYNPFPEEINRRLISVLTSFHFAPTQLSHDTLIREGYHNGSVFLTGNTVVDALYMVLRKKKSNQEDIFKPGLKGILVTAHRRENFDKPLLNICRALMEIAELHKDVEIVYPVHLNPNIKKPVYEYLSSQPRIRLISPLNYENMVHAMNSCHLVLTDSGGIQEEAPALGKPVLVMRETTERPEGVTAGVAKLVGCDIGSIVENTNTLLTNHEEYSMMAKAVNPYGDGRSATAIVQLIIKHFSE
jgi:UDP-N-acetylglucosamine 2-epimerase (non-hydrolysing)